MVRKLAYGDWIFRCRSRFSVADGTCALGLRRRRHDVQTPELRNFKVSFHCFYIRTLSYFKMSSTGGGWAQLRQQARTLETQVRCMIYLRIVRLPDV